VVITISLLQKIISLINNPCGNDQWPAVLQFIGWKVRV